MTADPEVTRLANRVSACAIGLAFAERSDAEALRELVGMAGGSSCALAQARDRLAGLVTMDAAVVQRAARLLETATRQVSGPHGDAGEHDPGTLLARG